MKLNLLLIVTLFEITVYSQDVMRIHQTNGHIFQFPLIYLTSTGDSIYVDDINVLPYQQNTISSVTGPIIQDIDGNQYPTVILGNGQHWMAENLRTTHFSNGDTINIANTNTDIIDWYASNEDGDQTIGSGNVYATDVILNPGNVCPFGWHVPSNSEWESLIYYIDNNSNNGVAWGVVSRIGGGILKNNSFNFWLSPNALATNLIGFNALPVIYSPYSSIGPNFNVSSFGGSASFWSSNNRSYHLFYDSGVIIKNLVTQPASFHSIRCLKN